MSDTRKSNKEFIGGGCGRKYEFQNGDVVRNFYFKREDLAKLAMTDGGFIKLCYLERKEADAKGGWGYFYKDDFVPDPNWRDKNEREKITPPKDEGKKDDNILPF